jgi:hypothetical protein
MVNPRRFEGKKISIFVINIYVMGKWLSYSSLVGIILVRLHKNHRDCLPVQINRVRKEDS